MLRWYQSALKRRPLLTQSITTAGLFATGDALAQHAVEGAPSHDPARTFRMAAYGGLVFGPAATLWYAHGLSRITFAHSRPLTIAARVLTDQCVFASTNLAVFLGSMTLAEGKGWAGVREKLKRSYGEALKMNWMVWPAVQTVNFAFVPLEHRVLLVNVVSIGWNCYLSFVNSGGGGGEGKGEGDGEGREKGGMKYPPDA